MTRAAAEPYRTGFEATVERRDGRDVVLSETYFYAESGGQPADRGTLGGIPVADVQKRDGAVVHTLETEAVSRGETASALGSESNADANPSFEPGDTVVGQIDETFRTYCMRAHTASHVLYGAGRQILDDLGYGGFDIAEEKIRVDFETSTDIDDSILVELERLTNRVVWDSLPVSWVEVPKAEALEREEIAFNTKTEEGVLSDSDTVRVVEIEEWDVAACGGTHVENTHEIGPVTVLERSNPGEGLTRVEFAVGPPAIRQQVDEKSAALDSARVAGTSVENLPAEIGRLSDELGGLERELADAKSQLVGAKIEELADETVARDGNEWLVGTIDGVGPNELADRVQELAGDAADVVALTGADGATFLVVGANGDVSAVDVIDEVTAEFGGGGGGSPSFAQGGGLSAEPEDVVTFLRE
ncbi:DHHA1 domain-containing protein [Haladaptatus pallidirubidus]|uniref:Alanyl-transfer RNA synthetases family profile domain-containing protein n=1 Tax=Haladaptatus pallidirubidus TaxID=1008152 RepID=A0AAV3UD63_9EURY|nr:DHHA1 domain-containing protein [Haladaptatus pallidirubidus]